MRQPEDWELVEGTFLLHIELLRRSSLQSKETYCGLPLPNYRTTLKEDVGWPDATCRACLEVVIKTCPAGTAKLARERLAELDP